MSEAKVIPCKCENAYQDKVYGKQQRVHTPTTKKPVGGVHRCTVCKALNNAEGK